MNKRILAFLLCLLVAFSLLASCGNNEPINNTTQPNAQIPPKVEFVFSMQKNSDGFYEVNTANDLMAAVQHPEYDYVLKNDIDMAGYSWIPFDNYSGTFNGAGKQISNLAINSADTVGTNMGMFGSVAATGKVENLHLRNALVTASETKAQNIGVIAGINEGTITSCTATGVVYDTRNNADGQNIDMGCLVGETTAGSKTVGGTELSVQDNGGIYTTEGLAADVKLFVSDSEQVAYGLVGNAAADSEVSGLWKDSFYSSERLSEEMQQRQKTVVDHMYKMGTVAWTVPVRMIHLGSDKGATIHDQVFKPGVTYYGLPYDHTAASYDTFMLCMDENNQVADWVIKELGPGSIWGAGNSVDKVGFTLYMGTDCSSAVGWSWMQVAPSEIGTTKTGKYEGGVHVRLTSNMIPNTYNQKNYGIYPVGEWTGADFDGNGAYKVTTETTTSGIVDLNGKDVMYEAYAMTRKGDGLLYGEPGGHARLVAEDPVVIRDANGKIDITLSYFITHEQGDGLYNNLYQGSNSSWRINYRYTFDVLMNGSKTPGTVAGYLEAGSGKDYIPITIRAMRDETLTEPVLLKDGAASTTPITSPMSGSVYSNYRILSTTVIVKDSIGKEIYNYEAFTGTDGKYESFRGVNTQVKLGDYHADALKDAPKGDYTFSVLARLTTGETFTVVENQAYQYQ